MQAVKFTLLSLLCSCLLSACGLRGPLYLPVDEPVTAAKSAESADDAEEKEDKKEESGKS